MKILGVERLTVIPDGRKILRNKYNFDLDKRIIGRRWEETQLLSLTKFGIKAINDGDQTGKVPASLATYQKVDKNDLVMCLFDLDVSAVFSGISSYDGMISPAYKCFKCKNHLLPKYADYYYQMIFDGRKYRRYSKNVRYSISSDDFMNLSMIIPPLNLQEKISNYLDKKVGEIDSLYADIEKQIEKLEEYKLSVITEAVSRGLNPNVEMKEEKNKWYGYVPKQWDILKSLYVLSQPITDGPHTTPELFDEGIPFVSAEAVSCGKGGIDFDHIRGYISQEFYEECCKKYTPKIDDIYLIKSGATTGKVSIVKTDKIFTIWSPLAVFRCDTKKMLPKYLFYCLQSTPFQNQIQDGWTYGTQQNIGMRTLEHLKVSKPPLDEQNEIIKYLDNKCGSINDIISKKENQLDILDQYKKSLIYEYVTGKKEVPSNY